MMNARSNPSLAALLFLFFTWGCPNSPVDIQEAPQAGERQGPCFVNGTCQAGFICVDQVCATAPSLDAGHSGCRSFTDCDDGNAEVNPGYEGWATYETPAGSWDWNCGGVEREREGYGSCSGTGFCSLESVGWDGATPDCGETGVWVTDCDGLTCDTSGDAVVQRCR